MRLPRIIDDNGHEIRRIQPVSMMLTEKITPLSVATMIIQKTEEIPERCYVELFAPGRSAGIYRTRIPEEAYGRGLTTELHLEHAISEVGDYVMPESMVEGVLPFPAAIYQVFSHYKGHKWQIGRIEATEDVVSNIMSANVLTGILSLLSQLPAYYMDFDFTTTPWSINFLRRSTTVSAEGRLSRNVTTARVRRDDSQLYTRAYLVGLPEPGFVQADTAGQYGIIETILPEADYTEEEAFIVATTYLEKHKRPRISVQIDGVDFSDITGEQLDSFKIGKLYRLAIPNLQNPVEEHITQLQWRNLYDGRGTVVIQLSEEEETAVKIIHEQGASQASATALANTREKESQETLSKKSATGNLQIVVSEYSNPTTYTINTGGLSTVNYAVLIVPDNEGSDTPVTPADFDYGICDKTKNDFKAQIKIPTSSLSGIDTLLLRWFAIAK